MVLHGKFPCGISQEKRLIGKGKIMDRFVTALGAARGCASGAIYCHYNRLGVGSLAYPHEGGSPCRLPEGNACPH
jgi:hypothetical protein